MCNQDKKVDYLFIGSIPKSKTEQVWSVSKLILSFLWSSSKFIVKNTPTVLDMAWEVKKEISNEVATQMENERKKQKTLDMNNKILALKENKK